MVAVVDAQTSPHLHNSRVPWLYPQSKFPDKTYKPGRRECNGIYVFGGVDQSGKVHGDLSIVYPNYYENEQLISTSRQTLGDFKKMTTPCVIMIYETLKTTGRGPCDRYSHGSCFIQPNDQRKLLVIWGGRNDFSFS